MNDVTILFPLPSASERGSLLGPDSEGAHGVLLGADVLAELRPLHGRFDNAALAPEFRVVAARIDPCFMHTLESECEPQVRLVMQPLLEDEVLGDGSIVVLDTTLHLFYRQSGAEFDALVTDLVALREVAPEVALDLTAPLGVHPGLSHAGLDSAYADALKQVLLDRVGMDALSRLTFMTVEGLNDSLWTFGGFEVVDGELVPLTVAEAGVQEQTFANILVFSEADYAGTSTPDPELADDLSLLYNSNGAREAGEAGIRAAAEASLRIENPRFHAADDIDCVSCHVATQGRLWAEREFEGLLEADHPDRYTSAGRDLALATEVGEITASLRMLGYFGTMVAISQRTVNETAAVLDRLSAVQR